MDPWGIYQARMNAKGSDRRAAAEHRATAFLTTKLPSSLSYKALIVDGGERSMVIIDSDDLDIKTVYSMPGEDLPHGGLVYWKDNHWLITERDANDDLYAKGIMKRCSYLLRWVAKDNTVVERWCVVEDGTKYLTGEYSDRDFVVTRGDTRIAVTVARDEYSSQLNRASRFLIDDSDSENVLAYRLTKPLKLGGNYNGKGVFTFVMTECNTEDSDNMELRIANYYDYFPKETAASGGNTDTTTDGHDIDDGVDEGADESAVDTTNGRRTWF